eukprot:3341455-Rhodomonas_salina.1
MLRPGGLAKAFSPHLWGENFRREACGIPTLVGIPTRVPGYNGFGDRDFSFPNSVSLRHHPANFEK